MGILIILSLIYFPVYLMVRMRRNPHEKGKMHLLLQVHFFGFAARFPDSTGDAP